MENVGVSPFTSHHLFTELLKPGTVPSQGCLHPFSLPSYGYLTTSPFVSPRVPVGSLPSVSPLPTHAPLAGVGPSQAASSYASALLHISKVPIV